MKKINNVDLINELFTRKRIMKQHYLLRTLKAPFKMVYPRLLKIFNIFHRVKVLTFFGNKMDVVLPDEVSTLIWRYGFFEVDTCYYMLKFLKKGMVFIDIGAHLGFFTLLASYLVGDKGKIISFEPTKTTYLRLLKNVINIVNVRTFNYAVFDKDGIINFNEYGQANSVYNSIFLPKIKFPIKKKREYKVRMIKIDTLIKKKLISNLDMIKIDAESAELNILNGMKICLKLYKPIIILEVGDFLVPDVPKSKEIVMWLEKRGYKSYELLNKELIVHKKEECYDYKNLLFIHKDYA